MRSNACFRASLISACLTLCYAPLVATADDFIEGPYTYTIEHSNATITGFDTSYSGALSITNQLGDCPVTAIRWDAFAYCTGLTSVTIPDGITDIWYGAFQGCSGLTEITLPESLTGIEMRTFKGCSSLTSVTISTNVTFIEDAAFSGCSSLTSIMIPNSVTHFGARVFADCSGLTSAMLSTNITYINSGMFSGCFSLIEITIPASVETIWGGAFDGCTSLTAFIVAPGNLYFASVDGVLYEDGTNTLTQCPLGKTGVVTIPDGVNDITARAFADCSGLTAITLPASVTYIGSGAFEGCIGLTEIVIPASVTEIWDNAFGGCTGLTAINVDAGNATYASTDGILYSKDKTTLIQCPGGKTSITIPASITDINWYAFDGCAGLTAFIVDSGNEGYASEDGILYDKNKTILYQCPSGKSGSATIPASVTDVEYGAFEDCTGLTSLTFKGNAPTLGWGETFELADQAIIYYLPGASGWGTMFGGHPTRLFESQAPTIQADAAFGFAADHFGFTISGQANLIVVVEACTNLSCGIWTPVVTNTLDASGALYFSDPSAISHPSRFYRIVLP